MSLRNATLKKNSSFETTDADITAASGLPRCIIVDDDETWRLKIEAFLRKSGLLEFKAAFNSPSEAFQALNDDTVEIAFLDIDLPEINGIELLRNMSIKPAVIFITASPEYGALSYEFDAIDYLVKPFEYLRFYKAALKAVERCRQKEAASGYYVMQEPEAYFIKDKIRSRYIRIIAKEVLYIEAGGDYVEFQAQNGKFMVHTSMKELEATLSNRSFIRVHRSFIVNKEYITAVEDNTLVMSNKKLIPVGKAYKDKLFAALKFLGGS